MMKKKAVFFLAAFLAAAGALEALDIELIGGVGNFAFQWNEELPPPTKDPFSPDLFLTGRAAVSGEAGSMLYYSGGYERDQVLGNRLFGTLGIRLDYASFEGGVIMGILNTETEILNPGFAAGLGLGVPGIFFIDFNASSTIGSVLETTGGYFQRTGDVSACFWIPHVIFSLNAQTRSLVVKKQAFLIAENTLNRYFFRAEFYSKNAPLTVKADFGYETLESIYLYQTISSGLLARDVHSYRIKAFFAGAEAMWALFPGLKLVLGVELPVYPWVGNPVTSTDKTSIFFKARTGFVFTVSTK